MICQQEVFCPIMYNKRKTSVFRLLFEPRQWLDCDLLRKNPIRKANLSVPISRLERWVKAP
jgi:hypothetical protein